MGGGIVCCNSHSFVISSWNSSRGIKVKGVSGYSGQAPFSHCWVYVNEVAFGKLLKMGAGCQQNQPWLGCWNVQSQPSAHFWGGERAEGWVSCQWPVIFFFSPFSATPWAYRAARNLSCNLCYSFGNARSLTHCPYQHHLLADSIRRHRLSPTRRPPLRIPNTSPGCYFSSDHLVTNWRFLLIGME